MHSFKQHIINESSSFLNHKISDVLTNAEQIQDELENLGSRHLLRLSQEVVNQIRKILHDDWGGKHTKSLKELQKAAAALSKTIEEKGDLKELLPAVVQSLSQLSGKVGGKVNDMKAPEEDVGKQDFQSTPPNTPPQDPNQQPQEMPGQPMPDAGQPPGMPPAPPMGGQAGQNPLGLPM